MLNFQGPTAGDIVLVDAAWRPVHRATVAHINVCVQVRLHKVSTYVFVHTIAHDLQML